MEVAEGHTMKRWKQDEKMEIKVSYDLELEGNI